jgi:hypothetical protein
MVPATAVRPVDGVVLAKGGAAVVFVIEDGVPRAVRVALGVVGPESVVVATGLAEGAVVAANPPRGIDDRRRVAAVR